MITSLLTRPCTILHRDPSGEDTLGNVTHVDTAVETVCELQQRQRNEDDGHNELSESSWLLVLNADETISARDAVVVSGERYELLGEPWDVWNPLTQQIKHIEATVKRTSSAEGGS